jgi:hypothetical protein
MGGLLLIVCIAVLLSPDLESFVSGDRANAPLGGDFIEFVLH